MAAIIDESIHELDSREGWELLDRQARQRLGMSAEGFVRAWEAGEFDGRDDSAVVDVALLLPFGR
jgi:hypothetical protein